MVSSKRWESGKFSLPLVVFTAGAALSIALGLAARQETTRGAQARFDAIATDAARKVEGRFDDYLAVLIGLRARFNTSETVTRSEFRDYVAGLNLARSYPGFQLVNYAPYVDAADKRRFEEQVRRDPDLDAASAANFSIQPPGERAGYYPLTFIEPLKGNEKLIGKDLGAMPNRGNALEQARDTGGFVSSGRKIHINGRNSEIALAVRLPVYHPHMPIDTVQQRRAAYIGSVGAGFSVADMMRNVIADNTALRLRLIDAGPNPDAIGSRIESRFVTPRSPVDRQLLFDNAPVPASAASQSAGAASAATPKPAARFERTLGFDLGGHAWLVEVGVDQSELIGRIEKDAPWLIVFCGIAISTLLAGIVYSLNTSRERAEELALSMTRDLRTSQQQLDEAQHIASVGSWLVDARTGQLQCSDETLRIFGFPKGEQVDVAALMTRIPEHERVEVRRNIDHARASHQRVEFEHTINLPNGAQRWVQVIAQVVEEDGRTGLRGILRDDTYRHKAAMRMRLEHEVAQLLVSDGESEAVISRVLAAVCSHIGWDCGVFWAVRESRMVCCNATWHAGGNPVLDQFIRISRTLTYRPDEGSLGRAWVRGEVEIVNTASATDHFTRDALAAQAGLATGLIVPSITGGTPTVMELFSQRHSEIDADTMESLRAISLQLSQYEQRKQAEQALRYVASHDALTGLSNRTTLKRELTRAMKRSDRYRKRFAVMFVDLDHFKRINDTLGHGVGDALLKACADRLAGVLREEDAVARFGGDEFVLVVENLSQASDAALVADKVLASCAEPFIIDGRELHVSASIGVSMFPEDGADGEALLKNADTAMYRAKDKGRGGYEFYAAQMNAQGTERLMLESGLRRALDRGELEMHYQPKMDLRSQRVVGVEALMRWRHPVLGLVSPAQFIPIAEETGLIIPMGMWALRTACAHAREWQQRGLPAVQMSVNLSVRQFASPTLIDDIAGVLDKTGLNPELLELEITESVMMRNPETAAELLEQLRKLGVGLAIDDFGTGYSSLSYLKRFPFTTVKIDRSFVKDLSQDRDADALTDGIVTLAHGLRMKVVAEGVETVEQLNYLRSHGCDEIQGYWLCKPVTADDVCAFMARHLRTLFAAPVAA